MIQMPFSLFWIKVLACFIRSEKRQIFKICAISLPMTISSLLLGPYPTVPLCLDDQKREGREKHIA